MVRIEDKCCRVLTFRIVLFNRLRSTIPYLCCAFLSTSVRAIKLNRVRQPIYLIPTSNAVPGKCFYAWRTWLPNLVTAASLNPNVFGLPSCNGGIEYEIKSTALLLYDVLQPMTLGHGRSNRSLILWYSASHLGICWGTCCARLRSFTPAVELMYQLWMSSTIN